MAGNLGITLTRAVILFDIGCFQDAHVLFETITDSRLPEVSFIPYRVCENQDDEGKALRRIDRMLKKAEALRRNPEERDG